MKIVIIGVTGLIGKKLVNKLRERGHEALAASPSTGVNTITGQGLAPALAGAQVVVDVANAPDWEANAVRGHPSDRRPIQPDQTDSGGEKDVYQVPGLAAVRRES